LLESSYKKIIGYVPQDDIVLPELTVRENILHSARIRLPSNWSDAEVQRHVDILLSCLQLAHVKDSLVGSAAVPVISGGQRKRVSIGMELAALPMVSRFLKISYPMPWQGAFSSSQGSIASTFNIQLEAFCNRSFWVPWPCNWNSLTFCLLAIDLHWSIRLSSLYYTVLFERTKNWCTVSCQGMGYPLEGSRSLNDVLAASGPSTCLMLSSTSYKCKS